MTATAPGTAPHRKKFFSVEQANRMLPLVQPIVGDIARQWERVRDLEQRLAALSRRGTAKRGNSEGLEPYDEEVSSSKAELAAEQAQLRGYVDELERLGVELKSPDGLCDFPSLRDGREVYLCWRLGEPAVSHWHELRDGAAGRQPLDPTPAATSTGTGSGPA